MRFTSPSLPHCGPPTRRRRWPGRWRDQRASPQGLLKDVNSTIRPEVLVPGPSLTEPPAQACRRVGKDGCRREPPRSRRRTRLVRRFLCDARPRHADPLSLAAVLSRDRWGVSHRLRCPEWLSCCGPVVGYCWAVRPYPWTERYTCAGALLLSSAASDGRLSTQGQSAPRHSPTCITKSPGGMDFSCGLKHPASGVATAPPPTCDQTRRNFGTESRVW